MKTNSFLRQTFLLIAITVYSFQSSAQNQSMLIPVPAENSSVINYINPSNPVITKLPAAELFRVGSQFGPLGNPHEETDLNNSFPSMNEIYLGQHPMFAQQVVHDKDGNLLFFIVDNNIYNRKGEAFPFDPAEPNGSKLFLYGGKEITNVNPFYIDIIGENYNRFGFSNPVSYGGTLGPEIIIFPIYGASECYSYGVVFSIYCQNAPGGAESVYYRTLTYYDETHIGMSDIICLSTNFIEQSGCYNNANASMAISEYRPNDINANYILFIHYFNRLIVLPININGIVLNDNLHRKEIDLLPTMDANSTWQMALAASETEVKRVVDENGDYYNVATGTCFGNSNSDAWVSVV